MVAGAAPEEAGEEASDEARATGFGAEPRASPGSSSDEGKGARRQTRPRCRWHVGLGRRPDRRSSPLTGAWGDGGRRPASRGGRGVGERPLPHPGVLLRAPGWRRGGSGRAGAVRSGSTEQKAQGGPGRTGRLNRSHPVCATKLRTSRPCRVKPGLAGRSVAPWPAGFERQRAGVSCYLVFLIS